MEATTTNMPKDRAKYLLALRDRLNLTQADAAKRVGIHPVSWCRWERGSPMPELTYLGIRAKLGELVEAGAESTN